MTIPEKLAQRGKEKYPVSEGKKRGKNLEGRGCSCVCFAKMIPAQEEKKKKGERGKKREEIERDLTKKKAVFKSGGRSILVRY